MEKPLLHKIKTLWLIILACVILGSSFGYGLAKIKFDRKTKSLFDQIHPVRENNKNYRFANPLLGYSVPNINEFNPFQPLQQKIGNFISLEKKSASLTDTSVYFRDLTSGRWAGINEDQKYSPASMLKVVIMIAYYKEAESDSGVLSEKIDYSQALDDDIDNVPFQASSTLEIGKSYTVEELIQNMIINSDNGAKNALLNNINAQSLNQVYTDLSIQPPGDKEDYTISAKSYSVFFRVLYNATYLDHDSSEKALALLNKAQYKQGLVAGVPQTLDVAQKFGEHINTDTANNVTSIELHDCGIIYYPNRPYVLCVMTRGKNLDSLTNAIQNISRLVYQSVDSNYKN